MKLLDSEALFRLLRRRDARNAARVDRTLAARAEQDVTLWISDSSGFTRRTHDHGILQFLAVMTRCYDRILPRLRKRGARVLSTSADNIVAMFADPAEALAAAVDVQRHLRTYNRRRRDADRFHLCIGIHTGRAFVLRDNVYGACVNVACKVGEDLADKDEILVTGEVARRVKGRFRAPYARSAVIGGQSFDLHRVSY